MVKAYVDFRTRTPRQRSYKAFVDPFERELINGKKTAGDPALAYNTAIKVCATGRDLMMRYYSDWRMTPAVETDAKYFTELFSKSVKLLKRVSTSGCVEIRPGHVKRMIENTSTRYEILTVIASRKSRSSKIQETEKLFDSMDPKTSAAFNKKRTRE